MSMLTCLTLSAEPFQREVPRNVAYVNYVSKFKDAEGLHSAKLDAIFKVKTKYFFYQDDDDPLPNIFPIPEKSIIYGDFFTNDVKTQRISRRTVQSWDDEWHMTNPLMVHKAICNTQAARTVANLLPRGEYMTETLLYFFMCKVYGFTYDPSLEFIWNKQPGRMHTKAQKSISNSVLWLRENRHKVLAKLAC